MPGVPRVRWDDFLRYHFDWRQDEHTSIVAPTGQGKSHLMLAIAPRRKRMVILVTKPRDATFERLVKARQWRRITSWPPPPGVERALLWPKHTGDMARDVLGQRAAFGKCFADVYANGYWCIGSDETRYLCDQLGLRAAHEVLWQQGRSLFVPLVTCIQRPAFVPLAAYDQATHLFLGRDNDERNLKLLGGIGAMNSKVIKAEVAALARHDFLYLNTRDDSMLVTRVEQRTS